MGPTLCLSSLPLIKKEREKTWLPLLGEEKKEERKEKNLLTRELLSPWQPSQHQLF